MIEEKKMDLFELNEYRKEIFDYESNYTEKTDLYVKMGNFLTFLEGLFIRKVMPFISVIIVLTSGFCLLRMVGKCNFILRFFKSEENIMTIYNLMNVISLLIVFAFLVSWMLLRCFIRAIAQTYKEYYFTEDIRNELLERMNKGEEKDE